MIITRDFQDKYFKLIDDGTILALLGSRRVGKSTFVEQYLKSRPKLLKVYFNFDEFSTRQEVIKNGIESLINSHLFQIGAKPKDKIVIFIDEVQKEPLVFDQIKLIYDKQKQNKNQRFKFILTGSASLTIHKEITESLAGRVEILRVNSFSLTEAARLNNITKNNKTLGLNKIFNPKISFENLLKEKSSWNIPLSLNQDIKSLINNVIEYGSLPEALELSTIESKQRYLINYRDTYLEKDIRVGLNIGDLKKYSALLTLLASQCGSLVVKKDLKEKTGIAYNTLDRYLSILNSTYILHELEPYIFSASRRLVKSSKVYFFDNGIIALLTGFLNMNQLLSTGIIGTRFENLIINELIKKITPYYPICNYYFWRTSGGNEIDLIIDFKEKVIPCEIKWTENIRQIKTSSILKFLKDYKKAKYGIIIYNGNFYIDETSKIIYLPVTHLPYF